MPARSKRLRRCLFCTGVTLGLLVLYIASWPFVVRWSQRHFRPAIPFVDAGYAPLQVYYRNELPGTRQLSAYFRWCNDLVHEHLSSDASAALELHTQVQFAQTPLRDVVSYLSEVYELRIELLDGIDGDVEITINASAPLREILAELTEPLELAAAPIGRKLVIGPPETVQQLAAEASAAAKASKQRGNLIVLGGLVLFVVLIALIVRRRLARRHAVIYADAGN